MKDLPEPGRVDGVVPASPPDHISMLTPRVFQDDTPEDGAVIQPLLRQITVYPLNPFTGKMQTTNWKNTPSFPAPDAGGKSEVKWVVPEKFFDELPGVMKMTPPLSGEESLYDMIDSVLTAACKDP